MIKTENAFKKVLNVYGVNSMKDAKRWIANKKCNQAKKADFMNLCKLALVDDISFDRTEQCKQYLDELR